MERWEFKWNQIQVSFQKAPPVFSCYWNCSWWIYSTCWRIWDQFHSPKCLSGPNRLDAESLLLSLLCQANQPVFSGVVWNEAPQWRIPRWVCVILWHCRHGNYLVSNCQLCFEPLATSLFPDHCRLSSVWGVKTEARNLHIKNLHFSGTVVLIVASEFK